MNMFSTKCVYEATTEENAAGEQNGDHEEVNYPCGQCGKHFSQKGNLDKHRRSPIPLQTMWQIFLSEGKSGYSPKGST